MELVHKAGFPIPIKVEKQFEPDPTFPTVVFLTQKNPEQLTCQLNPQSVTVQI